MTAAATTNTQPESLAQRRAREHRERRTRLFPPTPRIIALPPKAIAAPTDAPLAAALAPAKPYGEPVTVITKPIEEAQCDAAMAALPMLSRIMSVVARDFGFGVIDLKSARRTADVVKPRQIAMYLAKTMTLRSFPEIGRRFGGKDHTTVLHAVRKMERLIVTDVDLAARVAALKDRILKISIPAPEDADEPAPLAPIETTPAADQVAQ